MPQRHRIMHIGLLLGLALGCSACATQELAPAIPAPPVSFADEGGSAPPGTPAAPAPSQPPELFAEVPVTREPRLEIPPAEATPPPAPPPSASPALVIEQANGANRLRPTLHGYQRNHTAIQKYPYIAGKIYDIYSAPDHPTTVFLPPGERLAAPPVLNQEGWDIGLAEVGAGDQRQEVLVLRPVMPRLDSTMPLLLQSGLTVFCRLRSFEKTSMVAVTWEVPRTVTLARPARSAPSPQVDLTRLHTAYIIERVHGAPPWEPLDVYDDGQKTVIRFRESLRSMPAPAVFVRHADGHPGVVAFTPYDVPDDPTKGAYYVVQGLWPQLELRGEDGQVVRLTRQALIVPPFKPVTREAPHGRE